MTSGALSEEDISTAIAPTTAKPPTMLLRNKYRVEGVLGEGAFGRVYLAFDTVLRRSVAIKELLATRDDTDHDTYVEFLERFQREARAAAMVNHPHIVAVFDLAQETDGTFYLVMEYV